MAFFPKKLFIPFSYGVWFLQGVKGGNVTGVRGKIGFHCYDAGGKKKCEVVVMHIARQ